MDLKEHFQRPYETFDVVECAASISVLFERRPIVGCFETGSPIGAYLNELLCGWMDDAACHRRSLAALQMQAVIDGVAMAVHARLRRALEWDGLTEDHAYELLGDRIPRKVIAAWQRRAQQEWDAIDAWRRVDPFPEERKAKGER